MQIEVGFLLTAIGVLVGFLTYYRNRDKDVRSDASENAVIRTKLDAISSGIELIRADIQKNESRVESLSERVTRVEESSKQAHKRIDNIEKGDM
ncbi:hypothetical protein CD798_18225 [Bacillaceae bacterium SAOS 7]|nr:hypothetical protein CD798_18225 [Bacillaceae bacterium SAOS 7]